MTYKHTPAPWVISGSTLLHVTGVPANIHIATIEECRPSDARLIASAPDLLAALEYARDFFLQNSGIRGEVVGDILRSTDAAIKKATGVA